MLHLPSPVNASRAVAASFQRKAASLLAFAAISAFLWQPTAPAQIPPPRNVDLPWYADNPCEGMNVRPARPGHQLLDWARPLRRTDVDKPVVTRTASAWHIIPACNCLYLRSDLFRPCADFETTRSFEEEICWTISGSVGITAESGLVAKMLTKLEVEMTATAARQHCTKETVSYTIKQHREQCFNTKIRFVTWRTTVAGREVTSCVEFFWLNLTTGERDSTFSGEGVIHLSGTAHKSSASGFQIAPKLCAGYVAAVPDPFDGHTSAPCCDRISGCHIFQTPPNPCCGIWTLD